MKKNLSIVALVVLILSVIILTFSLASEIKNQEPTTTIGIIEEAGLERPSTDEESTVVLATIVEEITEAVSGKEEYVYENAELFKEIEVQDSDLPFAVSGVDAIETVKLYIPRQSIGDEDVWENTYIAIECLGDSENIAIKFDPVNGIYTGNIVPKNEMLHSNLTYLYINGEYSQNYTFKKDGEMIIFTDFSEGTTEIKICNRSANPIFEGVIDGKDVVVNDIIIKLK